MKKSVLPTIGVMCNITLSHQSRKPDGTLVNLKIDSSNAFIAGINTNIDGIVTLDITSDNLSIESSMIPGKSFGLYSLSVEDPPKVKRKSAKKTAVSKPKKLNK